MAAAADLTLKRNDTYPPLKAVLSDNNGAINLAAASQVKLIMQNTNGATALLVTGVMSIASAPGGYVQYQWATGDTRYADTYNIEFEIAWAAGGIETVPSNAYRVVTIIPDLEAA